jgi:two-component system chemotaxis sensor kinase CheA
VAKKSPDTAKASASSEDESIRVSLRRLEDLINNVGELVILQTVLNQHRHLIESSLLNRTISQLAKITKDIQDTSMSLRMVPLKQSFQKMQRIVRDTSKVLGKEIHFELIGEHTELDKTVVDQLGDPLVHLIRNAVDHGIESADDRIAAGKPAAGNVSLSAAHKGGKIVIEIKDDGKGLDPVKLKNSAIEKGILKPNQAISDKDAIHLIFAAGFSTKKEVTEVSGRGVGMDVVKTNIEKKLGGEIQLETELGKGSTFRIVLPLTLAIVDGMVIRSGTDRYIVPLAQVHESLQPQASDVHSVSGLGEVLSLRGEELPLIRLTQVLGRKSEDRPASECIAIVVRNGEAPFSMLVDDILGQQQIVIKQLGGEVRNLKGVTGGAILGDGKAALILDLNEIGLVGKSQSVRGAA